YLPNRSYVHIEGFTVIQSDDRGIRLNPGSSHDEIGGNTVRWVNGIGIQAVGTTDSKITRNQVSENSDHGISLLDGSTRNVVEGNESSYNVFPDLRRANGLYLSACPNNLIVGNRWHHNQDTGEQVQSASDSVVSIQNVSWGNGDHGFDHL